MIAGNFNNLQPGLRDDWQEVEGNWVLKPASGPAQAVVHFVGGEITGLLTCTCIDCLQSELHPCILP
jgi:hypothetical protein